MKAEEMRAEYAVMTQPKNGAPVPFDKVTEPKVDQGGPLAAGEFTYIDISSVDNKLKRVTEYKTLAVEAAPSRAKQRLKSGDVLVSMTRPNLNAVAIVPPELDGAVGSTGFHVLRATEGTEPRWLYYAVQTKDFISAMSELVQGALYPAVRPKDIRAYEIPHPPIDQQKRIVAEIEKQFSRLDEAVANLKRVKANLKRYKAAALKAAVEGMFTEAWRKQHPDTEPAGKLLQRILTERRAKWEQAELVKMQAKGNAPKDDAWKRKYPEPGAPEISGLPKLPEGWVWASLEQLTTQIADVDHKMPKAFEGGIPYVSTKDFKGQNEIDFAGAKRISPDDYDALCRKVRPENGDILLSRYGTVGEVRSVKTDMSFQASYSVAILKPINSFGTADFVATALKSDVIQSQIKRDIRGVAQPDLGLAHIRQFVIPFPSLEEQKQIIAEGERHLSLAVVAEAQVNANLLRADHLRQSILKRGFSGQLLNGLLDPRCR